MLEKPLEAIEEHFSKVVDSRTPALRTPAPHASAGIASRSEADVAGGAREDLFDQVHHTHTVAMARRVSW